MKLLEEKVSQIVNIRDVWRWAAVVEEHSVLESIVSIEKNLDSIARRLGAYWGNFDEVPPGAERYGDEKTQAQA